ncbi:hypothetical protein N7510_007706 [Penicillium lagena]|uniref:uncharacterized protein n=1 Tax=Penicillium lagena TaxID=94218 RepID=UPI002540A9AB|nr:uncharacterized protein N7510_007706 [Penicillium lagena]KAJ5610987.1 hypothetical protein N7510_007706 [Penicillium lagena]
MDAKPQRIRVRGDENAAPFALPASKSLHQRNKSTPALNLMMQNAVNNGARRTAFGDLSNTKNALRPSRDDSALEGKPVGKLLEKPVAVDKKPAVLAQPAQRPMSMSGLKSLLNNVVDSKPVNPAGKALPVLNNTTTNNTQAKRNNLVFRDELQPPHKLKETSKETTARSSTVSSVTIAPSQASSTTANDNLAVKKASKPQESWKDEYSMVLAKQPAVLRTSEPINAYDQHNYDPVVYDYETDETKAPGLASKDPTSAVSEPEEYWDDEAYHEVDGQLTAPSQRSRGDITTGTATTVIYPKMSEITKGQMFQAKDIVESTRTPEDIEEDFWDTSMVAEYGSEIFLHLRTREIEMLPEADYMANQAEIQWSMRSVLMDWLVQVHHRFTLLPETLYLCVNYIDRFLSRKIVSLGKLQLVGATALFIAAKYEEITAPSVQEIVYMVDGGYTIDEILKAERFMLNILDFELGWPGPMSFLRRISKADDYDLETRTVAKYFLEVTIMDERFVCTPPSFAAAGAHCLARLILYKGCWTPAHAFYSGYLYAQLIPVITTMLDCCVNPRRHHGAVFEKYSDRRFKRAALYVETEIMRGFLLPPVADLSNPARLDGYANY